VRCVLKAFFVLQILTIGHTHTGNCSCTSTPRFVVYTTNPDCTVAGHANHVLSVAFSSDGKRVVSGSRDTLVKIWNAETGAKVNRHGGCTL